MGVIQLIERAAAIAPSIPRIADHAQNLQTHRRGVQEHVGQEGPEHQDAVRNHRRGTLLAAAGIVYEGWRAYHAHEITRARQAAEARKTIEQQPPQQ